MDRNKDTNQNTDRDLPGYPHYSPEEDILNPQNGFHQVKANPDALPNSQRIARQMINEQERLAGETDATFTAGDDDEIKIVPGTDADVTREDLIALGKRDEDADLGDDEQVENSRVDAVDNEDDLDIPGDELDDSDEAIGEEDEENNYYSLGGDRNDALEEDQA